MTKFEKWFNTKFAVGGFPLIVENRVEFSPFKYIINVSDEYHQSVNNELKKTGNNLYWFPINEANQEIGINSIFGALMILLEAEITDSFVYLHCKKGVNRSKTVQDCYYYMRTKIHIYQPIDTAFYNPLHRNCHYGHLPPIKKMEEFLNVIQEYVIRNRVIRKGGIETQEGMLDFIKQNSLYKK